MESLIQPLGVDVPRLLGGGHECVRVVCPHTFVLANSPVVEKETLLRVAELVLSDVEIKRSHAAAFGGVSSDSVDDVLGEAALSQGRFQVSESLTRVGHAKFDAQLACPEISWDHVGGAVWDAQGENVLFLWPRYHRSPRAGRSGTL